MDDTRERNERFRSGDRPDSRVVGGRRRSQGAVDHPVVEIPRRAIRFARDGFVLIGFRRDDFRVMFAISEEGISPPQIAWRGGVQPLERSRAPMAELVDASDSKSDSARSAGSIPARGTTLQVQDVRKRPKSTDKESLIRNKRFQTVRRRSFASKKIVGGFGPLGNARRRRHRPPGHRLHPALPCLRGPARRPAGRSSARRPDHRQRRRLPTHAPEPTRGRQDLGLDKFCWSGSRLRSATSELPHLARIRS